MKALPFGTLAPATQTPTKRAPTKRSRAQLDFSKMEAPVSAPVEAKKAKIATKLTMRPKNQQGKLRKKIFFESKFYKKTSFLKN